MVKNGVLGPCEIPEDGKYKSIAPWEDEWQTGGVDKAKKLWKKKDTG